MNYNNVLFILLVLMSVWMIDATTHVVVNGGVKCIDKERHALLDFKANDPQDRLSTWKVEEENDCCKWRGVTCNNQTGHVTELYLNSNGLEGEVSPSLLHLTYLSYLDLSYNSFTGTIPMSIGSLTELRSLQLSSNSFTGIIPRSIGSLTELRYLDLSFNSFYGTIPRSIGSLTELRYLHLFYNSFTGTIPPEFGNLTNLESLYLVNLRRCTIENLDWVSHLSRLEFFYMDGTSLAKANNWVNAILSLQKLSELSLSNCELSHVMHPYSVNSSSSSSNIVYLYLDNNNLNSSYMYDWLFPLTRNNSLQRLDLSNNMLDGIPIYIANLSSLTYLYISNNSIAVSFSDFLYNLSASTLQYLDASYNQLTGSLSDNIQKFSSIITLDLSDNQLNGSISEKLWELPNLQYLDLSSNSLRGPISPNIGNSKIRSIILSNNPLIEGVPSTAHMANLSYVQDIDLSSCKLLGPHFPKWIQNLKNLTTLNIANTGISDTIPMEFWNLWPSQLFYLNLSSNNITGQVTNLNPELLTIDLSSNNFYGPISDVPSNLNSLNLSRNKFYGGISFLCQIFDGVLQYLDLSHNSFYGQLPDCLWHFKELTVLNLGNNKLSGRIPRSLESLIRLEVLYLYNNTFSGELPLSLKNCTSLNFLDLGENNFSGNLPVWIGETLSRLYILSLKSNNFFGPIPLQLCQLVHLQILDLSMNNLDGTIPSCVDNLTAMVQKGFSSDQNLHYYSFMIRENFHSGRQYVDHSMIQWQGNIQEFSTNLRFLKSIDISSNNLTGEIPYELTDLLGLVALNLSKNSLIGEIPQSVGQMKELLTLDLSRNRFSGKIPSSMSQMASLNYLDVSYNNLSGRVPTGSQLQTFDPSWFVGNVGLCGLPAAKHCPGDEDLQVRPTVGESEDEGEVEDDIERWFYIGGASGFAAGFWIVCSGLLLNRRGRHTFFSFLDNSRDWVHVKVVVFIAKLERVALA